MKNVIVFALLLISAAPVFSDESAWSVDGYGTKVNVSYPTITPDDLQLKTSGLLVQPGSSGTIDSPVWSPDGKSLVFSDLKYICRVSVNGGEAEVKYASAYLKDPNTISYDLINGLIGFGPDGNLLYFLKSDENYSMAVYTLDINSGDVEIVASEVGNARMGGKGRYLMYADASLTKIYGQDLTTGENWSFPAPIGFSGMFTSSADGKYFIYSALGSDSSANGNNQFFRIPLKGGASEQLSTYPGNDTGFNRCNPICLSDGEWILYDDIGNVKYSGEVTTSEGRFSYDKNIWKMCVFNMGTSETLDLFPVSTTIDTQHGQVSPDGKQICYLYHDVVSKSERYVIYIKDISSLPVSSSDPQLSVEDATPTSFALTGNYPNPFNPSTHIAFTISASGMVHLSVYDVTGRKVRDMFSATLSTGAHEMVWDGRDESGAAVSSGTYIARLKMGNFAQSHRMTLMK